MQVFLQIDLFADTAAILISIVSKDIMGCSGGKLIYTFSSESVCIRKKKEFQKRLFWFSNFSSAAILNNFDAGCGCSIVLKPRAFVLEH